MKLIIHIALFITLSIAGCNGSKNAIAMITPEALNGTWTLDEIPGAKSGLAELYPDKKPSITFDAANLKINGYTGCNNFNGPFKIDGAMIDLSSPLAMTRMMCPGDGESTFVKTLQNANGWTVRDNTLRLMTGDMVVMKLSKLAQ